MIYKTEAEARLAQDKLCAEFPDDSFEDWDEDFLNEDWDDFDKIDRKVEEFSVRIAEAEEELARLKKREIFSLADSGGLASEQEILEYKIYVLDEQKILLSRHKDILEGKPGIPLDVVFTESQKRLDAMRCA